MSRLKDEVVMRQTWQNICESAGIYFIEIFLDINECQTNPCDVNANCTNIDGGYVCSCHMGYEGNGTSCKGTQWKQLIILVSKN